MPKQFDQVMCVLCAERPSSPTGEHVWPSWFFKMFPPADGPYQTWIGHKPALDRHKQPRRHGSIPRVKLPTCEPCNGELDRRFEKPAKSIVRRVMASHAQVELTAPDAMQCAQWFLKTWLFLACPDAISTDPAITLKGWEGTPADLWRWTINDRPPPAGLSLWAVRPTATPSTEVEPQHLMLPIVVADGEETEFKVHEQGVKAGSSFLQLTLVFHPGWEIDHPLEADGRSLRLWPPRGDNSIDLGALQPSTPNELRWVPGSLRVAFAPGAYSGSMQPAISSRPLDLQTLASQSGVTSVSVLGS